MDVGMTDSELRAWTIACCNSVQVFEFTCLRVARAIEGRQRLNSVRPTSKDLFPVSFCSGRALFVLNLQLAESFGWLRQTRPACSRNETDWLRKTKPSQTPNEAETDAK